MIEGHHITNRMGGTDERRAGRRCGGSYRPGWNMSGEVRHAAPEGTAKRREGQVRGERDDQEPQTSDFSTK